MNKTVLLTILFSLVTVGRIQAQCDTNYLYIGSITIVFADSTEQLKSVTFKNEMNSIVCKDNDLHQLIGINKQKECRLVLKTSNAEVTIENVNEYISFIGTKYDFLIYFPANHDSCIAGMYTQPDGYILIHSQSMKGIRENPESGGCVSVEVGPTGYANSEKFDPQLLLD